MNMLFEYNWIIRDKWFEWCKQISKEELLKPRIGGYQGVLKTLFHIIDVEQRWVARLTNTEQIRYQFEDYMSLDTIKLFSDRERKQIVQFLQTYSYCDEQKELIFQFPNNKDSIKCKFGEVLRHMIVHEVHHIGQISVWAREIGKDPVSANFIGLNLMEMAE